MNFEWIHSEVPLPLQQKQLGAYFGYIWKTLYTNIYVQLIVTYIKPQFEPVKLSIFCLQQEHAISFASDSTCFLAATLA